MINSTSLSPLVSVIIPVYNCQDHLSLCVNSILKQTYKNIEILIADDCSIDKTAQIINSFSHPKIKTFFNKNNLGVVTTRNHLIEKASGKLIAFQDADDWSHHKRIENQVALLSKYDHIGICSTGFSRINETGKSLFSVFPQVTHSQVLQEISPKTHPALCYPSVMTYKTYIEKSGYFQQYYHNRDESGRPQYIGGEDIDLLYRILEYTQIRNIPEPYYYYRISPLSLSNAINLEKYFPLAVGPRIAYLLRQQRLSTGRDLLQDGKPQELDIIRKKIQNEYNIHDVYSLLAPRMADQQLGRELLHTTLRYLRRSPISLKAYIYVSVSVVRYILGHNRYKRLRAKLFS